MADGTTRPEGVKYTLLENGLDFISHGLLQIAGGEPADLKYAVLNLGAGIELVLKERLRREDWRQLFSNPKRVDEKAYETGNFRSVSLHECLDRLEEAAVDISPEWRRMLEVFYDRRNRIQHFRFSDTKEAIEGASVEVISVVLDLIAAEFEPNTLDAAEQVLLVEIRGRLGEFQRFRDERTKAIQGILEELKGTYGEVIRCPSCLQETLLADCNVQCPFCGYHDGAENAADLYLSNVVGYSDYDPREDGGYYPRFYCPNCDNEALIEDASNNWLCFACGFSASAHNLRVCPMCGDPADPDGFAGDRCQSCDNDYLMQDNT